LTSRVTVSFSSITLLPPKQHFVCIPRFTDAAIYIRFPFLCRAKELFQVRGPLRRYATLFCTLRRC